MDFAFSEDQLAFRDAVRDLLTRECGASVVRDAWSNADGRSGQVWDLLSEMGVLGMLTPEVDGGMGMTMIDFVLLVEECGRVALPEPIIEHAVVCAPIIGGVVSGSRTVTSFIGGSPFAIYADSCEVALVERDRRLFTVERNALRLTPEIAVDGSRRLSTLDWSDSDATEVGGPLEAAAAFDRGALGAAALLLGLSHRMLEMSVEYASERRQFGAPIGSFQAVKHQLANARIALEFARPLVTRAAYSLSVGDPDASTHVSMAKAQASDAAMLTSAHALQCHGAIGYSFEYDLHMWMKRAWALSSSWGDAGLHRARVAKAVL